MNYIGLCPLLLKGLLYILKPIVRAISKTAVFFLLLVIKYVIPSQAKNKKEANNKRLNLGIPTYCFWSQRKKKHIPIKKDNGSDNEYHSFFLYKTYMPNNVKIINMPNC